jgi:hypothetical protein
MRQICFALAVLAMLPATAHAATEASTSDRLQDRRQVAAGTRAYSIGFQDGGFYANGWHITGEMGGIWAPPLKLADGVWFGVDGVWAGPATRFTSGQGYVRYALPELSGLTVTRTDFVPDGRRAALFGLSLTNPAGTARTVTVKANVHSELLTAYPWAETTPSAAINGQDTAAYEDGALVFRDGALSGLAGSNRAPVANAVGPGFRGARPGSVCQADQKVAPFTCDDGPFGRGAGGELGYRVTIGPRATETVWLAVAATRQDYAAALQDPAALLRAKRRSRAQVADRSRLDLPGDRRLQSAVEWGKQNLADLTQSASDLKVRWVNQGKDNPRLPIDTLERATFIGAGYPDYPWLFATDGEYTAFAAVALGQFTAIKAHLRALRDVSDIVNGRSGKVAHEIVTDGSVYFGANEDPGNTDETVKFPSAVALVWRWTGDRRFLADLYDFSYRAMRYVTETLDADQDGWPEGLGNVERAGMGEEKLDNAVYSIRGLYDLAELARAQDDEEAERWATRLADRLRARFDATWWNAASLQYADSLRNGVQVQQQHWTGVTPMEVELELAGRSQLGLAPTEHGLAALAERDTDCFSGRAPLNPGLFHTGCEGGPEGKGERIVYSLNTAIKAVADGNYGRREQRVFTAANALGMTDEQPGALPEVLPSPDQNRNLDRCWTCRSMFMQAWGHYGTAWPVIHQQLGVRPSIGTRRLEVVPNVPSGQNRIAGANIRIGDGAVAVRAEHRGRRYTTTVRLSGRTGVRHLLVGVTLPAGSVSERVRLNGRRPPRASFRTTRRGLEVLVPSTSRRNVVTVDAG